jgi:hypothetical protein
LKKRSKKLLLEIDQERSFPRRVKMTVLFYASVKLIE